MSTPRQHRHFVIVPSRPRQRRVLAAVLLLWALSLLVAWSWSARRAAPELTRVREQLHASVAALATANDTIETLRQRESTLKRSDDISRTANQGLQDTLTERDEEIAQLRADVAFYERLVGSSGQRRGLTVHSIRLTPEAGGAWRYSVTLTQNLNRGKISKGDLTLRVDGAKAGQLQTLDWPSLLQHAGAAPQPFSFRYFQQVEGSLMLPADFAPHRVQVRLRADGADIEQAFPWDGATNAGN
jgi:hypothetical protein